MVKINGELKQINDIFHYLDVKNSSQDKLAGDLMSDIIGDTFIDFEKHPPSKQWTNIMKALRVHGFKISFREEK